MFSTHSMKYIQYSPQKSKYPLYSLIPYFFQGDPITEKCICLFWKDYQFSVSIQIHRYTCRYSFRFWCQFKFSSWAEPELGTGSPNWTLPGKSQVLYKHTFETWTPMDNFSFPWTSLICQILFYLDLNHGSKYNKP